MKLLDGQWVAVFALVLILIVGTIALVFGGIGGYLAAANVKPVATSIVTPIAMSAPTPQPFEIPMQYDVRRMSVITFIVASADVVTVEDVRAWTSLRQQIKERGGGVVAFCYPDEMTELLGIYSCNTVYIK